MGRRILFACAECETALVWPVEAEPRSSVDQLVDATFAMGCDDEGRAVVELRASSRWKANCDSAGAITCPQGHQVGVRTLNGDKANARLSLMADRVITREMRGRV
ncbi:MAG: hypothetical protein P8N02_09660 [Actinomycetota bacterium]|jgi:hypothetical protein|nr:hypothetical protein [Actinomycetota bacterium]